LLETGGAEKAAASGLFPGRSSQLLGDACWRRLGSSFRRSGRRLPYVPPVAPVHTNAQICAHPRPQTTVAPCPPTSVALLPAQYRIVCAVPHLCPSRRPSRSLRVRPILVHPLSRAVRIGCANRQALTLHPKHSQDKLAKRHIRGPTSWHPPDTPQTSRDRHSFPEELFRQHAALLSGAQLLLSW